ncbi:MAG: flagellar hook-basal body complex protein FliE [Treponema sp.]|nr:flagellar hook-basal body complex protein FliE [Treponema sp.]
MIIQEFGTLQLARTEQEHFGFTKKIDSLNRTPDNTSLLHTTEKEGTKTFRDFLFDSINKVNDQQIEVNSLTQKFITNPEEVNAEEITIAMSKARMSLNLAQNVIDRIISSWDQITTTR